MGKNIVIVVAVGALVGGSTAVASAGSGDAAHGGAHITVSGENRTFEFTALERAGEDHGEAQLQARQVDVRAHLDLDCLRVSGGRAVMSGTVRQSNDVLVREGDHVAFAVVDGGEGLGTTDLISLVAFRPDVPFDCETQELPTDRRVERGDVQVRQG